MKTENPKRTIPPSEVWERVWDILEEVSDENREDDLGKGYLLRYEGWGGLCVEGVWSETEAKQIRRGIDTETEEAEEEREAACREYAEQETPIIIEEEWEPELRDRGYYLVCGGYDPGGLYGRTWALFVKDS